MVNNVFFTKAILFLFIIFSRFLCIAQLPEIIADSGIILRSGIYRNFEEFKYNRPSIDFSGFSIKEKMSLNTENRGIEVKLVGEVDRLDVVYGFCDGRNIYLAEKSTDFSQNMVFNKLTFLGRYCLFQKLKSSVSRAGSLAPTPLTMPAMLFSYVLNTNNGGTRSLSLFTMREILEKDPEMFNQFQKEKRKKKKMEEYIILFSKRHFSEIKR